MILAQQRSLFAFNPTTKTAIVNDNCKGYNYKDWIKIGKPNRILQ